MTCEIAILNNSAVALAADSAVTLGGDKPKIWNTANKIFAMSKYHPVGVMIYGNANLMGVPWETIIKSYRRNLGSREFPRLLDYAKHFVDFINGNKMMFTPNDQMTQFKAFTRSLFVQVLEDARKETDRAFKDQARPQREIDHEFVVNGLHEIPRTILAQNRRRAEHALLHQVG